MQNCAGPGGSPGKGGKRDGDPPGLQERVEGDPVESAAVFLHSTTLGSPSRKVKGEDGRGLAEDCPPPVGAPRGPLGMAVSHFTVLQRVLPGESKSW